MSYPASSVALPGLWSEKHPSGGTKRKALGWDPDSGARPVGATESQVGREWGAGGTLWTIRTTSSCFKIEEDPSGHREGAARRWEGPSL